MGACYIERLELREQGVSQFCVCVVGANSVIHSLIYLCIYLFTYSFITLFMHSFQNIYLSVVCLFVSQRKRELDAVVVFSS